jgi:hypothetical protein
MKRPADVEVQTIVDMVRMCQLLNTLPAAGGLLDQDSYFIYCLRLVMKADEKKEELERARAKAKAH